MNGVTIVDEILCRQMSLSEVIACLIFVTVFGIALICAFGCLYKYTKENKTANFYIIAVSTAITLATIGSWFGYIRKYNNTHMEYVVEIDDSVTFNDFFSRYEFISQDGNQYRVRELAKIDGE